MLPVFLDFETYYSPQTGYSLSGLSVQEYVFDPRFEVTAVSIACGDGPVQTFGGEDAVRTALASIDWSQSLFVAHNALFDLSILRWRFGFHPAAALCTMQMANATVAHRVGSASLEAVSQHLGLGGKRAGALSEVAGLRWHQIADDPALVQRFLDYAGRDTDLCRQVFHRLRRDISRRHLAAMALLLDACTGEGFDLDRDRLEAAIRDHDSRMARLLAETGVELSDLRSDARFAAILKRLGVSPPTKLSPTTGKPVWAFAARDEEFLALEDHEDERVRLFYEARRAAESSIEGSRLKRLFRIADLSGRLRCPMVYAGAHTGRFAGSDRLNVQNFPGDSAIRKAMRAPAGHVLVNVDASQIEARILAWLANSRALLDAFSRGIDVYAQFASHAYGYPVTKATHPVERQVGKVCVLGLGYGTGCETLRHTLAIKGNDVGTDFAQSLVTTYRQIYSEVPALWRRFDQAIDNMSMGRGDRYGPIHFGTRQWWIDDPAGEPFRVTYPELRLTPSSEFEFWRPKRRVWSKIWGGFLTENIVQHLAWQIVIDAILSVEQYKIKHGKRWRLALQVHDSLLYIVPESDGSEALQVVSAALSAQPRWADRPVPLSAEGGVGPDYATIK